jgi:hypothetical protein
MTDPIAWARAHRVCWEIEPLYDVVHGHGLQQTGYELRLFGRLELPVRDDVDADAGVPLLLFSYGTDYGALVGGALNTIG